MAVFMRLQNTKSFGFVTNRRFGGVSKSYSKTLKFIDFIKYNAILTIH